MTIESIHVTLMLLCTFSSLICLLTIGNCGQAIEKCIKYHREIDFAFRELRIRMSYHYIALLVAGGIYFYSICVIYLIFLFYYHVISGENDRLYSFYFMMITVQIIYFNLLLIFVYNGNVFLIIVKFYKTCKHLKNTINSNNNVENKNHLYETRTVNTTFRRIIDIHFNLCEIFNVTVSVLSFPLLYNKHISIATASFLFYAYIHNVIYRFEICVGIFYTITVLLLTGMTTLCKWGVSIKTLILSFIT